MFKVHCDGFIVHRQHGRSKADQMYQSQKKAYEKDVRRDPTQADKHKTLAGVTHKWVAARFWWGGGGGG